MSSKNNVEDNNKKGKEWRSINVSAGGGPPQAMTPEAAAKLIQQATTSRGREVKISFGPSRPPNSSSVNFGSLDLADFRDAVAAAETARKLKAGKGKKKNGLPGSEADMKALMSMFVDIMGMSMDTDKIKNNNGNGKYAKSKNKNGTLSNIASMFQPFLDSETAGGFSSDVGSWEAIRRTYAAAQDDDDDSMPDLDDMRDLYSKTAQKAASAQEGTKILPNEWESLEQVAIDDDLEAEERARKAAKKREKKHRKKLKAKEEAAQKAAEAAQKKREKNILSWRSRVVSACQSNELSKLEALLQESPLRKLPDEDKITRSSVLPHLEFLLPNAIAKNRLQLKRGKEARKRLATYILSIDVPIVFTSLRTGRTGLHTACFSGDVQFVQLVLEKLACYQDTDSLLPESYLNVTCDDSGWTPLHYAAISGSIDVLEMLLAGGCNISTITDDTHTWRESDGVGITPRELVEGIQSGKHEDVFESHGVALQEMTNSFLCNHNERRVFLRTLERVLKRLVDVETNGYTPPTLDNTSVAESEETNQESLQEEAESPAARKRKKKKKKKKQAQKEAEAAKNNAATAAPANLVPVDEKQQEKDPLVNALLGMGFTEEQISAAAKACGGTHRATADDLVTWILCQNGDDNITDTSELNHTENDQPPPQEEFEVDEGKVEKVEAADNVKVTEEAVRQQEEAAKRMAAKREEKRRRNREWNIREQARRQEQAKAKITQAMVLPRLVPPAPGYSAAYPNLQSTVQSNPQTGTPNGMHAGMKAGVAPRLNTGTVAVATNSADLERPLSVSGAPIPPAAMNPTAPPTSMTQMQITPQTAPNVAKGTDFPSLSQTVQSLNPPAVSRVPTAQPAAPLGNSYVFPMGDDEKTVSSFGSNRGLSVNSASFVPSSFQHAPTVPPVPPQAGVPPPGFRPPVTAPSTKPRPVQSNPLGEIRATAKAFVPSNFTAAAPSAAPPAANTNVASLPGSFTDPSFHHPGPIMGSNLHPVSNLPPVATNSFDKSGLAVGILNPGAGGPPTSGLLGSSLPDRVPSVTPVSQDSVPATSAASSLTPVPSSEEQALSIPIVFGAEPQPDQGTSSLLSSTFTNGPPVGGMSIWGDTQNAPTLGGLQSFSFGEGNRDKSAEAHDGQGTWGDLPGSSNVTSGQGSIW